MKREDVSVATMTWARDAAEEAVLRESLPRLASLGVPVYVTDGGSGAAFINFLRALPNFLLCDPPRRGPWEQARQSLLAARASGRRVVLYTEPDKTDFFRRALPEFVSAAPAEKDVGVVLASRSESSFKTFPEFQRRTEEAINLCCAEVVGAHFDFSYGPFLLNGALVHVLDSAPRELAWGWRPYAFGTARRLGYRVESIVKDSPCPPAQREDNPRERLLRIRQLAQSVEGLLRSTTAVETRPAPTPEQD